MRTYFILFLLGFCGPIAFAAAQSKGQAATQAATPTTAPAVAAASIKAAPLSALTVPLLNGSTFALASARGKYVVINFWATWCAPCVKEMPDFQKLSEQRKDVQVLGLAFEDTGDAEILAFLKAQKVRYPVGKIDVTEPLQPPLETPRGLPFTMIFDKKGALLKKFLGPVSLKELLLVIDTIDASAKS
jgi:thiol-disulfide isomerase/thioredoxin